MVRDLSSDPSVPLIGTLPPNATDAEATDWMQRQRERWTEGTGFSFAVAEAHRGHAVGAIGLWLRELAQGRATAGYSIGPSFRRSGYATDALKALTGFAWSLPTLHRLFAALRPE